VEYHLYVKATDGPRDVTSRDLQKVMGDDAVMPVDNNTQDPILIVKLATNQELKLKCIAKKVRDLPLRQKVCGKLTRLFFLSYRALERSTQSGTQLRLSP
jgi:hypothetical protein